MLGFMQGVASGSRHGIGENASEPIAATDIVQTQGNLSNVALRDTNRSRGDEEVGKSNLFELQ